MPSDGLAGRVKHAAVHAVVRGHGNGAAHGDAEVDHVVDEQLADQKFGGNVIELFLAVVERAGGRALLHEFDQQLVNATVVELLERGAKRLLGEFHEVNLGHVFSCDGLFHVCNS